MSDPDPRRKAEYVLVAGHSHTVKEDVHNLGDDHVVDGLILHEESHVEGTAEHIEHQIEVGASREFTALGRGFGEGGQLGDVFCVQIPRDGRELWLGVLKQAQSHQALTLERRREVDHPATDPDEILA